MKNFTTVNHIDNFTKTINEAILLKSNLKTFSHLGKQKTLVMLFFNASLRTRLSSQKAAQNLSMNVMILNVTNTWKIEFEEGAVMSMSTAEHIKEAAKVISVYADVIAVRAFPELKNKEKDEAEIVINGFLKYATVPVISLESATEHPLQALADAITITELSKKSRPKVVLSWAPHPKILPHAVPNSFVKLMQKMDVDFSIVQPKGYELNQEVTKNTTLYFKQEEAFINADFVYAKNWCSYYNYGTKVPVNDNWMITQDKINDAKFMHCLPVRRNVVVEDAVLDSEMSVVINQAENRIYAMQVVLKNILENL